MDEHIKFTKSWIRTNFGKKYFIKKPSLTVFLKNTELVSNGLRIAFAPERIALPDEVLLKLLQEVLPRFNVELNSSEICVLKINDHTIVCNVDNCLARLQSVLQGDCATCPSFINISGNDIPSVLPREHLDKTILEACRCIQNSLTYPMHIDEVRLVTVNIEQVNLCTIFGIILGYPVTYYFDDIEEGSNCLSMTPLAIVKIHDVSSQMEVFSFSYPQCLQHYLKSVVNDWISWCTTNKSIFIKNEIVTLPFVTL